MPQERVFSVDTLVAAAISRDTGNSLSTLFINGARVPNAPSAMGVTLYANFNGTTGFVTAANGADKIVDQYTIPAGTLQVGRMLRIQSWGIRGATTNSVVLKHFLGGTGAVGATISGGTAAGSLTSIISAGSVVMITDTLIQASANQASFATQKADGSATMQVQTQTAATAAVTADLLINLTMNTTAGTDQTTTGWVISLL